MSTQTLFDCQPTPAFKPLPAAADLISRAPEVDALLDAGAPLIICVSGGKDSRLAAELAVAYARERGFTGRIILVYANLNTEELTVTWFDALEQCRALAERLDCEFEIVARPAGGLMDRLRSRWRANLRRYIELECVELILPWATPAMRFCTSELKTAIIQRWVRKTFGNQAVICVLGIRRDESNSKKKGRGVAPIIKVYRRKGKKKPAMPEGSVDWNIIVEVKTDYVLEWILAATDTPAAYVFGAKRNSCAFCFFCTLEDLMAALRDPRNHPAYRAKCALEIASAFSYQGIRWLSDLAPELLTEAQRSALVRAKEIAVKRKELEAEIPRHLLFKNDGGLHGWPQTMPTTEEAETIARVRRGVAELYCLQVKYTTGPAVSERYAELIAKKAARDARNARRKAAPAVVEAETSNNVQGLLFKAA
jgi:hypothetical protein